MKKFISIILSITMLLSITTGLNITAQAENYSGKCGTNVTYSFDTSTGELTISGTGDMKNYDLETGAPWYSYSSSISSSIKKVTINSGVTSIGDYAFRECSSLTSVAIPDGVTSIGIDAFSYCTLLTGVTIPDSVTSIGGLAFYNCTSLTSVTIPDSVTSIGYAAFSFCTSLTSVTIPDSVTSIGEDAFYDTALYNDSSNWENDVLYIGKRLVNAKDSINGSYNIKSGTLTIADSAFNKCTSLTSVTIPDSVTNIGENAFNECTSLTSATIPDSVTSIGSSAFCGCSSLTSITIPNSVTSIGNSAFYNTALYNDSSNWENDVLYIGKHLIEAEKSINGYCNIKNGTITIANSAFYYCKSLTSVTIPDSVTDIGIAAFDYCTSLTSVTVPDSVTNIGGYAFYGCKLLANITVNPENKNYSSQDGVLFNKDKTELIQYPIGNSRTSYTIPDSVISIGDEAFRDCTYLTSVTIPGSVISIGEYAFAYCTSLEDVYYSGSESDWNKILLGSRELRYVTVHYADSSAENPEDPSTEPEDPSTKPEESTTQKPTESTTQTPSTQPSTTTTTTTTTAAPSTESTTQATVVSKPKSTSIKKATAGKKQFKVEWKKVSGVTGYQIQYSTDKKFKKGIKTVTVKGAKKTSYTIKKLKSKKTYYIRIRTYKGKNYSNWSKAKSVKVK